jgi:Rap1a immunity proteins
MWGYFGGESHCDACVDEVKKAKPELANLIRRSERLGRSRREAMPLMFNVGQPRVRVTTVELVIGNKSSVSRSWPILNFRQLAFAQHPYAESGLQFHPHYFPGRKLLRSLAKRLAAMVTKALGAFLLEGEGRGTWRLNLARAIPRSAGGEARVICALIDICYNPANTRGVRMKSLAVLFLILLVPNVGSAQKTTTSYQVGSALVESCKDYPVIEKTSMSEELPKVEVKIGFCEGYVEAHAEALTYEGKACIEADIAPTQLIAAVNKYLADHPELWNRGASWLVRNALIQAFPCSK